ncbi:MAG TPA: hypothetical protein VFA71_13780 [Terriglobales bacterium]|nr:hypothetical protein [Terriglobales bacterium]
MQETSENHTHGCVEDELQLLRNRITQLEASQNTKRPESRLRRLLPGLFPGSGSAHLRRRLAALALALGVVVLSCVLIHDVRAAATGQDALFIDPQGYIGINQTKPEARLDVNGDTIIRGDLALGGKLAPASGNLNVAGKLASTGDATVGGAIEAGNSDLYFTNTTHEHSGKGNTLGYAAIENSKGYGALMILGRANPLGRIVGLWDRLGIGKGNPQAALDVNGDALISGTINGEKPMMRFRVPASRSNYWGSVEQDIGSLCADEDGCTINLVMQDVTTDDVRTIDEWVVISQPQISRVRSGQGFRGYTRQSGGGEYWWELNTGAQAWLYSPWDWCKARNFRLNQPTFTGPNKFRMVFECHPNITALITIYDR